MSCLVGIPFKPQEFSPSLLRLHDETNKKASGRVARAFLEYSIDRQVPSPVLKLILLWRDWVSTLPGVQEEPQELDILGSSKAHYCIQFGFPPSKGQERLFSTIFQVKDVYTARAWCDWIAHVLMASTEKYAPLDRYLPFALPKGTSLICGDLAWPGLPSRLTGGPCTLGCLVLFRPNKTHIMDWARKNSDSNLV